jgi:hypothetical protein
VAQEPSGFRCEGFSPSITLLIPAFALRFAPRLLALTLQQLVPNAPLPWQEDVVPPTIRGFGGVLEPRYVVGAGSLDQ